MIFKIFRIFNIPKFSVKMTILLKLSLKALKNYSNDVQNWFLEFTKFSIFFRNFENFQKMAILHKYPYF